MGWLNCAISNRRPGSVFVVTLCAVSFLIVLISALIGWVMFEYNATNRSHQNSVALSIAESGVDQAIWELNYNRTASQWSGWGSAVDGSGNTVKSLGPAPFQDASGTAIGHRSVFAVLPPSPANVVIDAYGYVPNAATPNATRHVRAKVRGSLFDAGIITNTAITLIGNTEIDSFDSAVAPYNVLTRTLNGDIATNGGISLQDNSKVWGNATPGPTGTFTENIPGSVSGSSSPATETFTLDPIPATTMAAAQATNNNASIPGGYIVGGKLKMAASDVLTINAGTYYFTSIQISGSAQLRIGTGPVNIYVSGDIATVGNGIQNLGAPTNLMIYSTGTGVHFTGNTYFNGAIYAPTASMQINGSTHSEIQGAVAVDTFQSNGEILFHRDLQLRNIFSPFAMYRIVYWLDL